VDRDAQDQQPQHGRHAGGDAAGTDVAGRPAAAADAAGSAPPAGVGPGPERRPSARPVEHAAPARLLEAAVRPIRKR
jgi:hypothetical protein